MKNLLVLFTYLLLPITSLAQFETEQRFVQGGFNLALSDSKYLSSYNDIKYGDYSHNLSYSSGHFTRNNRAVGWTLNQSLSLRKIRESINTSEPLRTLRSIAFGGERFVEHYKSLSDKFSLYIRPGFGLSYRLQNQDGEQNGNQIYTKYQTNTFTLGANVSAGVAWLVLPKWALYGGFAFTNPISLSAGWRNSESITQTNPGTPTIGKGSFFNYNFTPSLSTGSINLGFRYFYTRNNSNY